MRVRLFVFESQKKLPDAVVFIDKQIARNPKVPVLRFIKLDLMNRTNASVSDIRKVYKNIFKQFNDDRETLHQLAVVAAESMRFGTPPLDTAFKAAERSVELLLNDKKKMPDTLAVYLAAQARIYYMIGALDDAVQTQEKVLRLQKGDPAEKHSAELLDYYRDAWTLQKKINQTLIKIGTTGKDL